MGFSFLYLSFFFLYSSLATATTDPSISLEDLLERDYKDKQLQQQQQQQQSTDWTVERNIKSTTNSTNQQQSAPLSLAHAVHLLQQAITHPLYQQSPPPELSGLVSVGRDNDLTNINANINEEQFERYARWLKQRREINSLRIKADETNLADIKKKRNILLKKQKQVRKKKKTKFYLKFLIFSPYVHQKKNKKCHVYLNNKLNILVH